MKILGVKTHYISSDGTEKLSAVDWWRVVNPLTHLAKNTEHEVTFVTKVVDEKGDVDYQWRDIGSTYDILYTSYMDSRKGYAYIKAIADLYGIKHIMDIDDNIFDIDPFNPAALRYGPGSELLQNAKIIIKDVDLLVCSTPYLAQVCSGHREKPIVVLPNYIDDEYYTRNLKNMPEVNGIHIGYMGSSTHFTDLMETGVLWALRRLVTEYPSMRLHLVGSMYEEVEKMFLGYEENLAQVGGARDFDQYTGEIWPNFPFDIGIAPLVSSSFNDCKSSIKYYEYALRSIAGVYSYATPYMDKVIEGETGLFAESEEEWYFKLKWLIDGTLDKKAIADRARMDVVKNYRIQDHWKEVQRVVESI